MHHALLLGSRVFQVASNNHLNSYNAYNHTMPSAVSPNPRAPSDVRHDYDDVVEDFLKDLPLDKNNDLPPQEPAKDIDEEVIVKKKRKPVPKLDETLLLSQNGVPRLRKITKSRLKFRGKGHEFSDISRLLNTYQLWLDDLYPRAKFRDAVNMAEKVGHSKRMQITRKAWLDATKPYQKEASPDRLVDLMMSGALPADETDHDVVASTEQDRNTGTGESAQAQQNERTRQSNIDEDDAPEDDELGALLAEDSASKATAVHDRPRQSGPFEENDDEEDELDALMAEQTPIGQSTSKSGNASDSIDFADDEEAMAGMDDLW